jgi:hypothetical protein
VDRETICGVGQLEGFEVVPRLVKELLLGRLDVGRLDIGRLDVGRLDVGGARALRHCGNTVMIMVMAMMVEMMMAVMMAVMMMDLKRIR